ncbi:MAG: histidine phosphatase superfamily [Linnemannia gamsii]|nr:MAG: histidine phosphatase superfamily [Linnemannia gamsii]
MSVVQTSVGSGLSTRRRTATILLPTVALFLAVSCLFGPELVQAVSVDVPVAAGAVGSHPFALGVPSRVISAEFNDETAVVVAEHYRDNDNASGAENEDRLAQSPDVIGGAGQQSPKAKQGSSSPLYSLPPMNWIRSHLGTKSPYPHESRPVGQLKDTPKGYELVQLHLTVRHGTRFPSEDKTVAFKALTDRLKGIKLRGFEWLPDWPSETLYPPSRGNLLSVQGDVDLYQIGRRSAIRYKTLLQKYPYDASTYQFYSSPKSRSSQSGYAFSIGFFEGRLTTEPGYKGAKNGHQNGHDDDDDDYEGGRPPIQPIEMSQLPLGLDKEMAVKYACPRWLESVDGAPGVEKENKAFEKKFLPALAERLTAILSAGAATPGARVNITTKDIGTIQNLCGFEVSMHNNDQTWCRLLGLGLENSTTSPKAVFENFEIAGDLDDYYTHGPGVPFNRHLGCKLGTSLKEDIEMVLADEGSHLKKRGDDDESPKKYRGVFKFGHSESILFFSSFLGLYTEKGGPLTADMTPEQYENRAFKTSKFSPFAANIAFEVYRPTSASTPNKRRRLGYEAEAAAAGAPSSAGLIRLLVNEVPVLIPGCGEKYFCEWSTFKQVLEKNGSGCDFDGCCTSISTGPTPPQPVCLSVDPILKK